MFQANQIKVVRWARKDGTTVIRYEAVKHHTDRFLRGASTYVYYQNGAEVRRQVHNGIDLEQMFQEWLDKTYSKPVRDYLFV